MDHTRDHRVSLKKFQGTKDIQKIFFDHRRIKLETNNGKIRRKSRTLNNTCIEKEITVVVMRYFELHIIKMRHIKTCKMPFLTKEKCIV